MKLTLVLAIFALAGCAANPHANNPDYRRCEYEAALATPSTNSAIADALRQHELIKMCMRNKGYTA